MERVVVVGAGAMGAGIAFVAARGGYGVDLVDTDPSARDRAMERVRRDAVRAGDESIVQRVRPLSAVPVTGDAILAIEAVPERSDLKRSVLASLAAALGPGTPIASNTSSLSVTDLAGAVPHPDRVLGLHFFNPPAAMKLVEVVRAQLTSDAALDAALAFVDRIGKTAVVAEDTPGFIVNRVARPFYLQSMRALDRGIATVAELDALARGAGFRMGPFELMDLIGLDVNLATSESVYERTHAARLAPLAMQREMVAQGRLGRKASAGGFYEYRDGDYARFTPEPHALDESAAESERIAVVGFGNAAAELVELLGRRFDDVQRVERDDLLDELDVETTIAIDAGDGTSDRGDVVASLDGLLGPETVILVDAYATALGPCAARMRHPGRLIGYGILGSLEAQSVVEVVDSDAASDEALALAQELFGALDRAVVLVEDVPGLFLGRTVGSIVNEAMIAVQEGVACADDVDVAMRLGTNYPVGPIAWGREIGGARISRVLRALAAAEGEEFGPHRSLWLLDADDEESADPIPEPSVAPTLPG